jgi:hypothetical protein
LRYYRAMNDDDRPMTTIAALREVLAAAFGRQRTKTCLQRLREAGQLPAGRQGRGGSASVTPKQAVLALLTLACDSSGDAFEAVPWLGR